MSDDEDANDAVSDNVSTVSSIYSPENEIVFSASFEELNDLKQQSHESVGPINSYQIKPNLQEKFKEVPVKEILRDVQSNTLGGKNYDPDSVKKWTIKMANEISEKVKDLEMKRYKHIIQVLIGERKGQGVKSGVRCLWDCEVDKYTSEIFMNDTIFCVTTVFAVYLY